METETKPGWKTTEFWLTMPAVVLGILATAGVFTPEEANTLGQAITQIAGAVISALGVFGYNLSRGKAKGGPTI